MSKRKYISSVRNLRPKTAWICPKCKGQKANPDAKQCGSCYHKSKRGKPTWNKGLTKETSESIRRQSEKVSKYLQENNPFKGRHHSEKTKKILRNKALGRWESKTEQEKEEYRQWYRENSSWVKNNPMKDPKFARQHVLKIAEIRKKNCTYIPWNKGLTFVDRKQRFAPYTEKHYDLEVRQKIFKEQNCLCGLCRNDFDRLYFHHIDYDKYNDERENKIFLCGSCHGKTTFGDRDYWEDELTEINLSYNGGGK